MNAGVDTVVVGTANQVCGQRLFARWLVEAGGAEATKFA